MAPTERKPVQGRPAWSRREAVDDEGNSLCVWYSLNKCKWKDEDFCMVAGRKYLHKCSVVVSTDPLRLCLATKNGEGGHNPGEACPHWGE